MGFTHEKLADFTGISLKFSELTLPKKTISKKIADFIGIFWANFARNRSILH